MYTSEDFITMGFFFISMSCTDPELFFSKGDRVRREFYKIKNRVNAYKLANNMYHTNNTSFVFTSSQIVNFSFIQKAIIGLVNFLFLF